MINTPVFGVRLDTSKFALQIDYCFLLALYYIWVAKTKQNLPCLMQYLYFLKSKYDTELNCGDAEKWEPLVDYLSIL